MKNYTNPDMHPRKSVQLQNAQASAALVGNARPCGHSLALRASIVDGPLFITQRVTGWTA